MYLVGVINFCQLENCGILKLFINLKRLMRVCNLSIANSLGHCLHLFHTHISSLFCPSPKNFEESKLALQFFFFLLRFFLKNFFIVRCNCIGFSHQFTIMQKERAYERIVSPFLSIMPSVPPF